MNPGRRGPRPYTDEPLKKVTFFVPEDIAKAIRVDAAELDVVVQALYIELAREYPKLRDRLLDRVRARIEGQP